MGALLLASVFPRAQGQVRLMPQLGIGHISSIGFSSNGHFAITGSDTELEARVWDMETGLQVRVLKLDNFVRGVAIRGDEASALIADGNGTVHVVSLVTGAEFRSFNTIAAPCVAFSPDGHRVLVAGYNTSLWNVEDGKLLLTLTGQAGHVTAVTFSYDGHFVLTVSDDATAALWNARTGQLIRMFSGDMFSGHKVGIASIAVAPNGRYVLTADDLRTARLWNVDSGLEVSYFRRVGSDTVIFSPDSRSFLTVDLLRTVRRWDTATGNLLGVVELGATADLVAYSPDGRLVLFGLRNSEGLGLVHDEGVILDPSTLQPVRRLVGHTQEISSVAISKNGKRLLTGSADGSARIWDIATGQQTQSLQQKYPVSNVDFVPDDRYILSTSNPETYLWDLATGEEVRAFGVENETTWCSAPSPDSRFVITGSYEGVARLWNTATGRQIRAFNPHTQSDGPIAPVSIENVAFTPDGKFVLTGAGNDDLVRVWSVATGQQVRSAPAGSYFSIDGRYVLIPPEFVSNSYGWRLWNPASGQLVSKLENNAFEPATFAGSQGNAGFASSSDGRYVVTENEFNTASVWEAATGRLIRTLAGHFDSVNAVAISSDGRLVLTGSRDTTVRLWDVATGKELAVLLSFENGGWAVTDSEGRYDSNDPDSSPGLIWVANGLRPIELEQLKDDYYTPNLLARILKGERLPDVTGLDQVPPPPEVTITSPWNPQTRSANLSLQDMGGGVGKVVVSVNDRRVKVLENQPVSHDRKEVDLTADLSDATLRPGENKVSVYAYDAGDHIRSHIATTKFTIAAATKGLIPEVGTDLQGDYKPQFYGIVIGTARFGDPAMNLQYPEHDAENMARAMKIGSEHLFGPDKVHLRILTTAAQKEEDQPTKKNIVTAFGKVRQEAGPSDVLLVYLSGHGVNRRDEKDSYYYLTADARSLEIENNPALRDLSTVSGSELRQWLGAKNMPLKEVLILDTCAAGAASEELAKLAEKRDVPPDQRRAVEFLKDATGTIILMGSAADKPSYEASKYGEGLLTYALLDGMHGRSVAEGGQLNALRWFQDASQEVHMLAASIGGIQKPQIAAPEGTGFPVALLDSADEAEIPLAAVKPELLHLTCHDDNDEDPLGLGASVRERMREISQPSARGAGEPPLVYLDEVDEGPTDALTPKIVYKVTGNRVSLRLRLDRKGGAIEELHLSLSSDNRDALAEAVAAKFVAMASNVPIEGANH
jgi:WD40 repeat protein